jgi:dTDP-glucose pyrophosphorylase
MDVQPLLVRPADSILAAIAVIDSNRKGIALVVDEDQHFLGTVTDGDIRRAILAGLDLKSQVADLLQRRPVHLYPAPISAPVDTPPANRLALMREARIRHLPLLDPRGCVVDLAMLDDWLTVRDSGLTAVVMAGGFGKRMRPLTDDRPKPMLPLGGKPLMEHLIEQLRDVGIERVQVTTHYKSEQIVDHFGDGATYGVQMEYVREEHPLGTAGALALLPASEQPLLVINGDILTRADFGALFAFHLDNHAEMTVGVREYQSQVPYGVVEVDGVEVVSVVEKPTTRYFVNAGIYLIDPAALSLVPRDGRTFDMPDLIAALLAEGRRVVSFPIREYWVDIGNIDHYAQAQADVDQGRF